jgi:hypothetical protein
MERSTIKLEVSLINKIKEIQALNGYKSVNETVKHILPKGTVTPETVTYEQPAFTLNDKDTIKNVSWNELKKAEAGKTWSNCEEATIIYKDEIGALIRFIDEYNEVYLNYFHFL